MFNKDYSNKKSINNIKPTDNETLVPFLAYDYIQSPNFVDFKENLETWHLGCRKILVGFIPISKDKAEIYMKLFWKDVGNYLEKTSKKRCYISNKKGRLIKCPNINKCYECKRNGNPNNIYTLFLSLDKFLDDKENDDCKGWDPLASTANEDTAFALIEIDNLIQEVDNKYPYGKEILQLLLIGFTKKEILERIDLGKKQSQGYQYIKKIQQYAKEIYRKNNTNL